MLTLSGEITGRCSGCYVSEHDRYANLRAENAVDVVEARDQRIHCIGIGRILLPEVRVHDRRHLQL